MKAMKARKKGIVFLAAFIWLGLLNFSDASHMSTILVAVAALILENGEQSEFEKRETRGLRVLSGFLAFFVTIANYSLYDGRSIFTVLLYVAGLLFGGYIVFFSLTNSLYKRLQHTKGICIVASSSERSQKGKCLAFFLPFGCIAFVYLAYLFLAAYPGAITSDSVDQLTQIKDGVYNNHHPFYHTMLIQIFYQLGYKLTGSSNAGAASYSIFQALAMAAIFAFSVETLYEKHVQKKWLVLLTAFYALSLYHFSYSVYMTKDTLFGGMSLLWCIFLYRIYAEMGKKVPLLIGYVFSSLGVCLFRNNGFYAFFIIILALLLTIKKQKKEVVISTIATFVVAYVLTGPVLKSIGIPQGDILEKLAIPEQQIARVIVEDGNIAEEDRMELQKLLDFDVIKGVYEPGCSDNVKNFIRWYEATDILEGNKGTYFKIWLRMGLKNPWTYAKAWIDETKGYYNAGYYSSEITCNYVAGNACDVFEAPKVRWLHEKTISLQVYLTENSRLLHVFVENGLCTWIFMMLFTFAVLARRKEFLMPLLALSIVASLLIATPVFNEFRYVYALYCMCPFTTGTMLLGKQEEKMI